MSHPVVHAEIRSTDPDATRAFFARLFGWSYSAGAYPGYTFVDTGVEGALPTAISPLQGDDDAVIWFVGVKDVRAALAKVSAFGGTPTPATKLIEGQQTTYRWPQVLPDGKHMLFMGASHVTPKAGTNGIYWGGFDGKPATLVMSSASSGLYASGYLLFLRENTLMAQKFDPGTGALSGDPHSVAENIFRDDGTWRSLFSVSENGVLAYQVSTNVSRSCRIHGWNT